MLSSLSLLQQFINPKMLLDFGGTNHNHGQHSPPYHQHHIDGATNRHHHPAVVVAATGPIFAPHFAAVPHQFGPFLSPAAPFQFTAAAAQNKLRVISEVDDDDDEEENGEEGENRKKKEKEGRGKWEEGKEEVEERRREEEGANRTGGGGGGSVPLRGHNRDKEEEEADISSGHPVNVIVVELGQELDQSKHRHQSSTEQAEEEERGRRRRGTEEEGATGGGIHQQHHRHQQFCQLSPAASITAEVQRVSIEDRPIGGGGGDVRERAPSASGGGTDDGMETGGMRHQQPPKKSSPEAGRLGRPLRKHAAVEDEEQLPLEQQQQQHPLVVPALHVHQQHHHLGGGHPIGILPPPPPPSSLQSCSSASSSLSPLISPEHQLALAAAAAAARPSPQQSGQPPPLLTDPAAAAIQLALLQHSHRQHQQQQQQQMPPANVAAGIKHEPLSHEDLLALFHQQQQQQANRELVAVAAAANCTPSSWLLALGQQQQQQMSNAALLSALISQHQQQQPSPAEPARLLTSIEEEQQQQQQAAPANVAGASSDISRLFEAAGRNQSTESTASTSGGSAPSGGTATAIGGSSDGGGGGIPRKQDIQTDIRMNRGRFQLVRKRGRSEVWNLFGQVVDTLTGARLPYVACYACKVLYTDTGGGTGNMTRHRCSVGSSYRSSSDTTVGNESLSINQSSSFESIIGAPAFSLGQSGGSLGATSPPPMYEGGGQQPPPSQLLLLATGTAGGGQQQQSSLEQKVWNMSAGAREAFAQSGSSGFLSAGSTTSAGSSSMPIGASASSTSMDSGSTPHPYHQELRLQLGGGTAAVSSSSTTPLLSRFLGATAGSLQHHPPLPQPPHSLGLPSSTAGPASFSSPSPIAASASAPSSLLTAAHHHHHHPQQHHLLPAPGHHFTAADKQLFARAVMQFCAQDMHNWDVVEGEGFKNLVETILFIGRRSHGDPAANTYDPVRQLIPTARQLKQVFTTQERAVLQATARDLNQMRGVGLALSCQTLEFAGERHYAISANYITDDWRITRRTLRVEKVHEGGTGLGPLIADVLGQFQLADTKNVLLTMDARVEEEGEEQQLPQNVQLLVNANWALNRILSQTLVECPDSAQVSAFIGFCTRAISTLSALDRCGRFPQAYELERRLTACRKDEGTAVNEMPLPPLLDFANGVYPAIKFVKENCAEILALLDNDDVADEGLAAGLRSINWQVATELELFLEPFHETAQMFTDSKQPHFQRILPEWYALMHECQSGQQSMDEPTTTSTNPSAVAETSSSAGGPDEQHTAGQHHRSDMIMVEESSRHGSTSAASQQHSPPCVATALGTPSWIRAVRQTANQRLREWAEANIRLEHRAATVLNPRLRHLPLICSDSERAAVYERIRELVGLSKPKRDGGDAAGEIGAMAKNEPSFKKRRRFLDRLEDCAMEEEDELDSYLRTTFAPTQTRDILEFWSSIGEVQFPRLGRLARFLLAASGAPAPVQMQQPSAGMLEPSEIGTLLNLRPDVLNSVNHQLAHHRTQQQHHQLQRQEVQPQQQQ